jgi:hypothetical protein
MTIRLENTAAPRWPTEVGDCEACGGTVYDYEAAHCPSCGRFVHRGCLKVCAVNSCTAAGCARCMIQDAETCEYLCGPECVAARNHVVLA